MDSSKRQRFADIAGILFLLAALSGCALPLTVLFGFGSEVLPDKTPVTATGPGQTLRPVPTICHETDFSKCPGVWIVQ